MTFCLSGVWAQWKWMRFSPANPASATLTSNIVPGSGTVVFPST
jgi:hypothetical protein